MRKYLLLIVILFFEKYLATASLYSDSVSRVDVIIDNDSLLTLFNSNPFSDHEYPATFIFSDQFKKDTLLNVGFRLRGNTSRDSQKKSFKVSFNTFVKGRKYDNVEKLNLNGEHNDPSVIRSKLYWDLLKKVEIPAPKAQHIALYINERYYGLYINVEHIDENFVKNRYGNKNGNLYKCLYPASLKYLGNNPDLYKTSAYELKTNEDEADYSDLAHFIDVINNIPDSIFSRELEKIFNVSNYLKYTVIDILTGNWDNYIFNYNNYYLYHNTETSKFEYIPYDTDNTFGIDWFGIDWAKRNIYSWSNNRSVLYDRIMKVPAYRYQFTVYMQYVLANYFNTNIMYSEIDARKDIIKTYVEKDSFYILDYNWDYDDFLNSYDMSLGMHVKYGLKPYIQIRYTSAIAQLEKTTQIISTTAEINIFPNPMQYSADIQLNGEIVEKAVLKIYDLNGQLVYSANHIGQEVIRWNGTSNSGRELTNGIYIISVENSGKSLAKSKIVIMRN